MKKNLVLIGMPGSGKTTVGTLLSDLLSLPLADTDAMVEAAAGRTIPELFASEGEPAFRDRETTAAREAAALNGAVIATGGGIILRPENMAALAQTGLIFFLDRPLSALLGEDHSGRPLVGSHQDKLKTLYTQRISLYRKYAQYTIPNAGTAQEAAALAGTIYREASEP